MARTKITSRQDNDQMKLKLVSNEELLKNKRKPPTASNRRKNKKVAMDFEKTHCDEVEAENSEIRMDVNETENVDGGNSSHLVARDGSADNNDGEGMEEDVYGEGMEEVVDGEGIEEDVDGEGIEEDDDNDGENESDGDQSKEMEEVEANKKRKGKAQTKDLEANEGKFCGGPTDSSILYSYKCHVARDVWIGKAWIYEHFPMFSPPPNMNYVNTLPRVMRWANGMSTYLDPLGALKHFRLMMDKMTRHDVIWNPYGNVRDVCPLEDITFYNGGICFFDIDEVYFGERVLRQFGIQQCIPSAPSPSLSSKNKTGKISMGIVTQYWECRDHYIIPVQNRVPLSQTPWDCVDIYLEWYNAISHPYLVNFNPRDPPPYITLYRPPPCDWNAIVNEIGRLLEVGMSSGGGEIPSEKREYFQRALALTQSKY